MTVVPRSVTCDRVRSQISLRLDGELSQLESRMVDAHVLRCPECRAFETGAVLVTEQLRAAPLEPLTQPVVVRRPARTWVARAQLGMAAALALVFFGAAAQIADRQSKSTFGQPAQYDTTLQLEREVQQIIADGRAFSKRAGAVTPL
jgi:predicted anti-sigma-YlaC factor YlaD